MPDVKTNFNQVINRHNTGSVKWDFIEHYLQLDGSDLLPMWVSDFDFKCPPEVQNALHSRVDHGIFGYSERDDHYYQAAMDWFAKRHNLQLKREWFTSVEGVVPGLALLIQMLSNPGDAVVIQGPYYGSFAKIITMNGRNVVENPLTENPQGYQFDFAQLESCFRQHTPPLLLLCNPHNPTGRCWTRDELTQLMTLCRAHGVTVISDEIWADLLLPGQTFTSVLHLDKDCQEQVIAATAASKTFGLSSLRISNFLIPNARMRGAFIDRLNAHGLDVFNALSMTAATAAYQHGEAWLDDLQRYLAENRRWFEQALGYAAPWCKMTRAEGTYLAWLDCRALGLDDDALQQALIHTSKIAPSMGRSFGSQGKGFIRINLGCPRQYLEDAIRGLAKLTP
ncbi:pyridoxal phosphate-dependent aminotransferase [Serratia ureilytica]|uniref:cysteine-S-conjugate beta-lyase n=1 Tax=Serratia ureilytica TaxID=300181 RepID=A0ABU0VRW5_9GAMM|nr:MalY/PatB family protein [Serratia ureilytica]MCU7063532.1 pyridoxal phosphate-dependent aminotransferase [Serratia ureilytica]MDQ1811577.1 MalY/PatB family protein [Serratia ureilytica]MDQ1840598.1 MalY/PatB family protein [Serratia ureilytica]MDQ1864182.1 MalY/PatB family protein [Serratia ureilytica]